MHRPLGPGAQRELYRAQDFLRRRRRTRVSRDVADDRLDQGGAPRQGAPRQALLPARPARQVGAHRREEGRPRPGHRRRRVSFAPRRDEKRGPTRAFFVRATCYMDVMFSRPTMTARIVLDDRSRLPWRFFGRLTTAALT